MSGAGLGYEILGAVKVKDGLFIGDALAAQDLEFVVSNKVTRVINCAGRQVPNHWESIGVVYLTYYWVDAESQVVLDPRDVVSSESFRFIEEALNAAESVLIHSVRGQSRSCCILGAYMMRKYSWGLRKTMEFLSFRRPDMNLKTAFMQQLSSLERRLAEKLGSKQALSTGWSEADFSCLEAEDLLLRNTYLNGQMGPLAEFHSGLERQLPRRLVWLDQESHDRSRLEKPSGADRHNLKLGGAIPEAAGLHSILRKKAPAAPPAPPPPPPRPTSATASREGREGSGASGPSAGRLDMNWKKELEVAPMANENGTSYHAMTQPPMRAEVPTAWGADGEMPHRVIPASAPSGPSGPQPFEAFRGSSFSAQGSAGREPRRGPATNIRDSLTGPVMGRRSESPAPEPSMDAKPARSSSLEPPPKGGSSRRNESPSKRPESPMRSGKERGSSPGPSRYPTTVSQSAGPQSFGFTLGAARATNPGPSTAGCGARGMGAFRSGGPVRVKADLIGDAARPGRSRPSTAPPPGSASTPIRSGSQRRPASPSAGQVRSSSSSRPPSPTNARSSPVPATKYAPGHSYPGSGSSPFERSNQRSMTAHLRRAPSPTPAFNTGRSSSAKPRWRS